MMNQSNKTIVISKKSIRKLNERFDVEKRLAKFQKEFKDMKKDIQELLRLYKEKSFDYAIENFADKLNQQERLINDFISRPEKWEG
ncbi:hypothetical protein [Brochothrix thermosphacta]|uniref:hypothetical protein n=1 Tax=Brochothrix thermosphacta TaxID=2756 RepID=UPI00083FD02A|nr:hypothetical protein [Brochothrix thermosphacta]ODJ62067.1 hypothetical protein BFR35_11850 [Brochothrix thermosphacta]